MNLKDAYQILQAEWVRLYNVEVGDTVKVLRTAEYHELGWSNSWTMGKQVVGKILKVCHIGYDISLGDGFGYPFFCLELVKKAKPKIELTCKVNNKTVPLNTLSEETILNIRRQS